MKSLPTLKELKEAFGDFGRFTFELLETIETKPHHLKFAAVNSQIALELFLKYLYVAKGKSHQIQKSKNGQLCNDFIDFSQILNHFYSSRKWTYGKKKELIKLMEARNSIVHRGQQANWNQELAENVVRTLFFIHSTAWSDLQETLLFEHHTPHKISESTVWRKGVQSFVMDLVSHTDTEPLTCLSCGLRTVVDGGLMVLEEEHNEDHLICLNCLIAINTTHEARVIKCHVCHKESYLIDTFNEQDKQLHVAKCSECETDTWVRQCKNCGDFYHPTDVNEVKIIGDYFCCAICSDVYSENNR